MALEDFTTYTEVDSDGDITVTSNNIDVDTMRRDALSHVSLDKGADHFGDFEHLVQVKIANSDLGGLVGFWGIVNVNKTLADAQAAGEGLVSQIARDTGGSYRIYIIENDPVRTNDWMAISIATNYYCTIKRAGTALTNKVYSDAARTILLDTLAVTCVTTKWRHICACMSGHYGTLVDRVASVDIDDLDLQEAAPGAPPHYGRLRGVPHWG